MHSASESVKPPDLAPVVAQMVDKLGVENLLCWGGAPEEFWMTFTPSHSVRVEAYRQWLIGEEGPTPSEMVICVDHLQSVGMMKIYDTLDDLKRVTLGVGFFHVTTDNDVEFPLKVDKPHIWWLNEFARRFDVQTFQRVPGGFYVIVYAKAH